MACHKERMPLGRDILYGMWLSDLKSLGHSSGPTLPPPHFSHQDSLPVPWFLATHLRTFLRLLFLGLSYSLHPDLGKRTCFGGSLDQSVLLPSSQCAS